MPKGIKNWDLGLEPNQQNAFGGEAMTSTDKLILPLLDLGLNKYEAKVYLTLIAEGVSTAKNISDITGIPYGKVYEIINSLAAKGFSVILPSKPMKCQAVSPHDAIITVKKSMEEQFEKLEKTVAEELEPLFTETKKFAEPKGIFWVVNGRANINRKIEQLIRNAHKNLHIFTSENGLKRLVIHKEALQEAQNNGVRILVTSKITEENIEDVASLNFCDIRHVDKVQNHLFSNGKESIIIEPVPDDDNIVHGRDIGIWVLSESFTQFLDNFFLPHFEKAKELDEKK